MKKIIGICTVFVIAIFMAFNANIAFNQHDGQEAGMTLNTVEALAFYESDEVVITCDCYTCGGACSERVRPLRGYYDWYCSFTGNPKNFC